MCTFQCYPPPERLFLIPLVVSDVCACFVGTFALAGMCPTQRVRHLAFLIIAYPFYDFNRHNNLWYGGMLPAMI